MLAPRTALAAAAAGGILALAFALPASADTLAPMAPTTCPAAQSQLFADNQLLAQAKQADGIEDSTVSGSVDFTPDAADTTRSAAQGIVNTDQGYVNALCGGVTGSNPGGSGLGWPWHHIPVGIPIGTLPGGSLSCAQIVAEGFNPGYCATDIPTGSIQTINGVPCTFSGTTWQPVRDVPVGTVWTVSGHPCHWTGGAWVPIVPATPPPAPVIVTAPAPSCQCTTVSTVAPAAPAQTIVEQVPVTVPPSQVFTSPVAPSQPMVSAGDGSTAIKS